MRLGDRIRVGSTGGLAGDSLALLVPRRSTLDRVLTDLLPCGGYVSKATLR